MYLGLCITMAMRGWFPGRAVVCIVRVVLYAYEQQSQRGRGADLRLRLRTGAADHKSMNYK